MASPTIEQVVRAPHPRLRPFVAEYSGYRMTGLPPGIYVGLPSRWLTFIVAFDDPVDVTSDPGGAGRERYWGMVAGLHARPAMVRHGADQHGVELALTPLGARALFGVPASELASTQLHLDEVVPAFAGELVERLTLASTWSARWAVLDDVLVRTLHDDARLPPQLEQAWVTLMAGHGAVSIDQLARDVGWSRRHLSQTFRSAFGLTPKTMGRVLRFERAQRLIRLPSRPSLSRVAAVSGYADQAHMTRDWNEFSGSSPSSWLASQGIPFVQDRADEAETS
ncbi:MAG: helix-turn-helix domain-containing protein [Actinomycetota bacterium]